MVIFKTKTIKTPVFKIFFMKRNQSQYLCLFMLCIAIAFSACQQKKSDYVKVMHDPLLYSNVMHKLNYVVIYDIFTPPVAARVFAYSNLAAYEVLASDKSHRLVSLQGKVKELRNIPQPPAKAKIDYPFASLIALLKVGDNLTFSGNTMRLLTDSVKSLAKDNGMPVEIYERSITYGNQVADSLIAWSKYDNYAQTRGATFAVSNLEGHWTPTPPAYFPAVEPLWPTLRCMVMDSANMFPPPAPPVFSKDTSSNFYKMAVDVMQTVNTLDSTKKWIANFWDCNSFKMHVEGHAMYATKAMTPCGHWMEIVGTIAKNNNADFYKTASAYAGAGIGIYDAFICCWFTKYKYDIIRPETYINRYINQAWMPYLQTPPFPEYNSAHSTISAAAATVLGQIFKNNTAFRDSSERDWGWPDRTFKTADEAAVEVSYSRFYGGIHYRQSVFTAYDQGKKIGNLVMSKLTEIKQ